MATVEIKATNDLKGASGRLRDWRMRKSGSINEDVEANMDALAHAFKAKVLQTPTSMEAEEFDCANGLAGPERTCHCSLLFRVSVIPRPSKC